MLFIRLFALAALFAIGGTLLAWVLTGNPRYRQVAWNLVIGALGIILLILLVFVADRFANPAG